MRGLVHSLASIILERWSDDDARIRGGARESEKERERRTREKKRPIKKDGCICEIWERWKRTKGWKRDGEIWERKKLEERERGVLAAERGGQRSVIDKDGEGGRKKEGKRWEEWGDSGGRSETGSGWSCAPTPV